MKRSDYPSSFLRELSYKVLPLGKFAFPSTHFIPLLCTVLHIRSVSIVCLVRAFLVSLGCSTPVWQHIGPLSIHLELGRWVSYFHRGYA